MPEPERDWREIMWRSERCLGSRLRQREIGGRLPEWDDLVAQTGWARERGAAVHLDGARIWESANLFPFAAAAQRGLDQLVDQMPRFLDQAGAQHRRAGAGGRA